MERKGGRLLSVENCREVEEDIQAPGTHPTWGPNSALLVAGDTRRKRAGRGFYRRAESNRPRLPRNKGRLGASLLRGHPRQPRHQVRQVAVALPQGPGPVAAVGQLRVGPPRQLVRAQ
ncbi:uncharacterized protein AAES06_001714 [Glossophaga mutica]